MFNLSIEDRLSKWIEHRQHLDISETPFEYLYNFWKHAPYIPYNHLIDPYNSKNWPTPWEIIIHNRYDDLTKVIMMAWSLRYTNKFKHNKIELKTIVNCNKTCYHNILHIDENWVINYLDNGPIIMKNLPEQFYIENQVEIK